MKLLVQADDYGFTKAVTYGIVDAIDNGALRNTGLFVNMPSSELAVSFMQGRDAVCFGLDFNIVSGCPVSDPKLIPSLVDERGEFIRSGTAMKNPLYATEEGRRALYPLEEVYRELRAQYDRFVALTGHKPGYVHPHSLMHENYMDAIRTIAREENVPFSMDMQKKYGFVSTHDFIVSNAPSSLTKKVFDPNAQLNKNPLKDVQECAEEFLKHDYVMISGHAGFVDADLLAHTTLSLERMRDHELCVSPWLMQWINDNHVELITYRDLAKGE